MNAISLIICFICRTLDVQARQAVVTGLNYYIYQCQNYITVQNFCFYLPKRTVTTPANPIRSSSLSNILSVLSASRLKILFFVFRKMRISDLNQTYSYLHLEASAAKTDGQGPGRNCLQVVLAENLSRVFDRLPSCDVPELIRVPIPIHRTQHRYDKYRI